MLRILCSVCDAAFFFAFVIMNSWLLFVILNCIFSLVGIMAVIGDDYVLALVFFFVVLIVSLVIILSLIFGLIRVETRVNYKMRFGKKTGPQPAYTLNEENMQAKKFVGFFPIVNPPLDFTREKKALRESFDEQERLIVSGSAATLSAFEDMLNEDTKVIYLATHIRGIRLSENVYDWRVYFSDGYFSARQFADVLDVGLRNRKYPLLLILNGCTSMQIVELLRSNVITVAISEPIKDKHASDFGEKLIKRVADNNKLSKAVGLAMARSANCVADMVRVQGVDWQEWKF